jgi:hypothetical protein
MNASPPTGEHPSLHAAAAALNAIAAAVHTAQDAAIPPPSKDPQDGSVEALAALLMLRELREELAGWEPGLIEAARAAGTSWADLAHPLGVASRQAAERRYLRVRPGVPGSTGEQRVQATRGRRAADRTVTAWARDNAADLRQLSGQIAALTDLPASAHAPQANLAEALADNDAANLITPLADTHTHLTANHTDLADRVDTITHNADRLRQAGSDDH